MKNNSYMRYALALCITLASMPQRTNTNPRALSLMLFTIIPISLILVLMINATEDEKAFTCAQEKYTQIDLKYGYLLDVFEKDPAKFPEFMKTQELIQSLADAITNLSNLEDTIGKRLNHAASMSFSHDTNVVKSMQEMKLKTQVYSKRLRALLNHLKASMPIEQKQVNDKVSIA